MLGEFRLLRRLGSGGMADVYLAEQTSLKRQVAIKVLRPAFVSDETYLKRFEREATAAAGLTHPNIVQVYAIGESDGIHYIAQEYVHGLNLREYLSRKGPPDLPVAMHIMKQVAMALQAANDAGIVHRDIKPENILVTRKGEVKVADFGLAQLTQGTEHVNLTQVGVTMGTPLYMSPEQVNGRKLDGRSDIYSYGVTCYHLLAGRPPFMGETAISLAMQHLNQEAVPLARRRSDLPRQLCDIVARMMAKSPDDRYADAQSVLKELKRVDKLVKNRPKGNELDWSDFATSQSVVAKRGWFDGHPPHLRGWVVKYLSACLLVGGLSAGIGWLARPASPLDAPITRQATIPKRSTAAGQYFLALSLVDNEAAWRSVGDYFPDAVLETRRAQEQLALLYLRSRRWREAEDIFKRFVALGADDASLKAKGLAGQAIVAGLRDDHKESQRIIAVELIPLRQHLDGEMEQLIRGTIGRNRKVLGDQVKQGYEDLFQGPVELQTPDQGD